ncbi:MAG: response regulator transcription factor, partial [Coprobacillaceae bacterium]
MHKVLIIEDNQEINHMIRDLLQFHQIQSVSACSGSEGLLLFDNSFDLIILDLMLPGRTGEEVIKEIKSENDIPIIILTAVTTMDSKLELFDLGADDYIVKPFHAEELLARIKVQLRKLNKQELKEVLTYKDIELNIQSFEVHCNNQKITMSKIEYSLLKILMENPNQVYTKDTLFEMVWNHEDSADDNTLNVHISKIRSKLKKANPEE